MATTTLDASRQILVFGITGRAPPSGDQTYLTGDFPAVVETSATMSDGQAVRIRRKPGATDVVITCGVGSEAHRLLGVKWRREQQQANAGLKVVGETMRAVDPTVGDVFSAMDVVIAQPPGVNLGAEAIRNWTLSCTNIDIDYGTLITVGGGSQ